MPIRVPVIILAAYMLVSCAAETSADRAHTSTAAIYSPPVRLGGKGSVILLPTAPRDIAPSQKASLEAPDRSPQRATKEWLRGTWLQTASPDDLSRVACNSGTTITYETDGTTSFFEGGGRWRLDGDRLTETLTEVYESGDPEMLKDIERPSTTRIRRVGPDEGATQVGGKWEPMLRCRPGDIDRSQ